MTGGGAWEYNRKGWRKTDHDFVVVARLDSLSSLRDGAKGTFLWRLHLLCNMLYIPYIILAKDTGCYTSTLYYRLIVSTRDLRWERLCWTGDVTTLLVRSMEGYNIVNWEQCQQLIVLCVHLDGSPVTAWVVEEAGSTAQYRPRSPLRYEWKSEAEWVASARGRAVGVSGAPRRLESLLSYRFRSTSRL